MFHYADDFVAKCLTESQAGETFRRIGPVMDRLGLTPYPAKARLVTLRRGKENLVFLGCTIRKKRRIQRAPGKFYIQRWPSLNAMKNSGCSALRQQLELLAHRNGLAVIAVTAP